MTTQSGAPADKETQCRAWLDAHVGELRVWQAKPLKEQQADLDKITHARLTHGVMAAREMMRALGFPVPPDELLDSPEELEARAAQERAMGIQDDWFDVRVDH